MACIDLDFLWKEFFRDPSQFRDHRNSKVSTILQSCKVGNSATIRTSLIRIVLCHREAHGLRTSGTSRQVNHYGLMVGTIRHG